MAVDYDHIYSLWINVKSKDMFREKNHRILDLEKRGLLTPAEAARRITINFTELSKARTVNWQLKTSV